MNKQAIVITREERIQMHLQTKDIVYMQEFGPGWYKLAYMAGNRLAVIETTTTPAQVAVVDYLVTITSDFFSLINNNYVQEIVDLGNNVTSIKYIIPTKRIVDIEIGGTVLEFTTKAQQTIADIEANIDEVEADVDDVERDLDAAEVDIDDLERDGGARP